MLPREIAKTAPDAPGVYFFKNSRGALLYIGKAKSLRRRMSQYAAPASDKRRKTPRMTRMTKSVEFMPLGSELEALIAESRLIKELQPRFNSAQKRIRYQPYLKIFQQENYPRIEMVWRIDMDGAEYFGPFPSAEAARATLDLVRLLFPARTCDMKIRPNPNYRPCFQYHIGRCLAPCADKTTDRAYGAVIGEARAFLLGDHESIYEKMRHERADACASLQFERARLIQNRLDALEAYASRCRFQVNAVNHNDVAVVCSSRADECAELFFLREGRLKRQATVSRRADRGELGLLFEEVYLDGTAAKPTPWDADMANVVSQWLYKNRARQELIRLPDRSPDALSKAAQEAARLIRDEAYAV